jgi:hypothetical protein
VSRLGLRARTRWLLPAGIGVILLGIAGCAQQPPTSATAIPPLAGQQARVWFYRDLDPNAPMATPYVRIDGALAGISRPGGASYRDVAAGRHQISVDSYVNDANQARIVDLAPGAQVYAKVVPLDNYVESGGEFSGGYHRDTYYLWLYPQEVAWPAIARSAFYAGTGTLTAAAPPR